MPRVDAATYRAAARQAILDGKPHPLGPHGGHGATRRTPFSSCPHRGGTTGESRPWVNCEKDPPTRIALYTCDLHGSCTLDLVARGNPPCCKHCPDNPARRRVTGDAEIAVTANGIGDLMTGLAIAAGWETANPGKRLVVRARGHVRAWGALFDARVTTGETQFPVAWVADNHGPDHFVNRAAAAPWRGLPKPLPIPPGAAAWAAPYAGCVVVAPFTIGDPNRAWNMDHWKALAGQLGERGLRVVAVGAGGDLRRLMPFPDHVAGSSPSRVAALIRGAVAVVGNESGVAHLAGALGVPAVVLAAQQIGAVIHGFWPKTTVIQAPWACSGCRWTGPDYDRKKCLPVCPNLQQITPDQVMAALAPHLPPVAFGELPAAVRPILARLHAHLRHDATHPAPDRRPTISGFLEALSRRPDPLVVETGCQRKTDDVGAGMSTTVFGTFLREHGGRLVSLDIDPANVATARNVAKRFPVEVIESDSVAWLRAYAGPLIDGLYLDSLDTYVDGSAEHALREIQAAERHLTAEAVVLFDDTWSVGDGWAGKGTLAVPYLLSRGWRVERSGYQVLLTAPRS